jgi:glycosyltransferase involved in cell wall biosynthesis
MPHVSVIIPTYNRANYVSRAVDSVLSQTFRDCEIIVVDDGSSDNTRQVLAAYGDRIQYVFQANAGPGAARNLGIRLSRGRYLAFLDSDDMWMPTFLEETVSALDAHPQVDVVTTGIYVGPAGRKTEACLEGVESGLWQLPTHFTRRQVPFMLNGFCAGALLVRSEVVRRYGGYYERGCTLGEDIYLWVQVVLNHQVYRLRQPLVWYDTEASRLGFASGRTHYPLEPVLVDAGPIWRHCPDRHRPFLASWLAFHALKSIHIQLATQDYARARWLVEHYPLVRQWRLAWWRIRFKLAFPQVTRLLRRVKTALGCGWPRDASQAGAHGTTGTGESLLSSDLLTFSPPGPGIPRPVESAGRGGLELESRPLGPREEEQVESAGRCQTADPGAR